MTGLRIALALLLAAAPGLAAAEEWEVILLKPRGCNPCVLLEESLKRSGQMQQAVLDDASGLTARIVRRTSSDISMQEWQELRALPYFDESLWRQRAAAVSAQVLLKRDGVIVSAGDIQDSTDLRGSRLPINLTMPDPSADLFALRNDRSNFVSDLYLRSWNLGWFYRLALDPALARTRENQWLQSHPATLAPPLGAANVMLMATASGATDNEVFNALRIEEIRDVLAQSLAVDPARTRIFYGGGSERGANALEVRDGRISLFRRDVAGATPFTPDAAASIFQSIRAQPRSRNLLVLIGHGSPDGTGMWGSPTMFSPVMLRTLHEHGGGDDVLVSGNCFGGVMARSISCGFFGARPDIVATGCQADAAAVAQSQDYLHAFFASLGPAQRKAADADGDGSISFAEAHWFASIEGDQRNITYTSVDALADTWFADHPGALPPALSVQQMQDLTADAAPAEAQAMRKLLAGFAAQLSLPLQDLALQGMRWQPNSGHPRPLASQLARRLLFLKQGGRQQPDVARLESCENRSVATFLKP